MSKNKKKKEIEETELEESRGKKTSKSEPESGKKVNPLVFVFVSIAVVIVAIVALMALRVSMLKSQLELASQYMEKSMYDEAIEAYQKALVIYPTSADAYLGLAEASIGKGELTEAINTLENGIQITQSENLIKSKDVIKEQVFATYVLNTYLINFLPGDSEQLEVIIRSEDMGFDVSWKTDDDSIATVDDNGLVTGKANGTTMVYATVGNDVWGYHDIECTVIVGVVETFLEQNG